MAAAAAPAEGVPEWFLHPDKPPFPEKPAVVCDEAFGIGKAYSFEGMNKMHSDAINFVKRNAIVFGFDVSIAVSIDYEFTVALANTVLLAHEIAGLYEAASGKRLPKKPQWTKIKRTTILDFNLITPDQPWPYTIRWGDRILVQPHFNKPAKGSPGDQAFSETLYTITKRLRDRMKKFKLEDEDIRYMFVEGFMRDISNALVQTKIREFALELAALSKKNARMSDVRQFAHDNRTKYATFKDSTNPKNTQVYADFSGLGAVLYDQVLGALCGGFDRNDVRAMFAHLPDHMKWAANTIIVGVDSRTQQQPTTPLWPDVPPPPPAAPAPPIPPPGQQWPSDEEIFAAVEQADAEYAQHMDASAYGGPEAVEDELFRALDELIEMRDTGRLRELVNPDRTYRSLIRPPPQASPLPAAAAAAAAQPMAEDQPKAPSHAPAGAAAAAVPILVPTPPAELVPAAQPPAPLAVAAPAPALALKRVPQPAAPVWFEHPDQSPWPEKYNDFKCDYSFDIRGKNTGYAFESMSDAYLVYNTRLTNVARSFSAEHWNDGKLSNAFVMQAIENHMMAKELAALYRRVAGTHKPWNMDFAKIKGYSILNFIQVSEGDPWPYSFRTAEGRIHFQPFIMPAQMGAEEKAKFDAYIAQMRVDMSAKIALANFTHNEVSYLFSDGLVRDISNAFVQSALREFAGSLAEFTATHKPSPKLLAIIDFAGKMLESFTTFKDPHMSTNKTDYADFSLIGAVLYDQVLGALCGRFEREDVRAMFAHMPDRTKKMASVIYVAFDERTKAPTTPLWAELVPTAVVVRAPSPEPAGASELAEMEEPVVVQRVTFEPPIAAAVPSPVKRPVSPGAAGAGGAFSDIEDYPAAPAPAPQAGPSEPRGAKRPAEVAPLREVKNTIGEEEWTTDLRLMHHPDDSKLLETFKYYYNDKITQPLTRERKKKYYSQVMADPDPNAFINHMTNALTHQGYAVGTKWVTTRAGDVREVAQKLSVLVL